MNILSRPWWTLAGWLLFAGCFALLTYCDLWRPEKPGMYIDLSADGLTVTRVSPSTAADRAGLRAGDRVVTWDGRDTRDLDLMIIEGNIIIGRAVPLRVERAGSTFDTELVWARAPLSYFRTRTGWMLLIARIVQLTLLVLALTVVFQGRPDSVTFVGAWMLATFAVFSVVPPYRLAAVWRGLPTVAGALLWLPYISGYAITAVLATFFAVFPRRMPRPGLVWAAIWIPMGLALIQPTNYLLRLVYLPDTVQAHSFGGTPLVATGAGYLVWGAAALARRYTQLDDLHERRRVRVIVAGLAVAGLCGVWTIPVYWNTPIGDLGESLFEKPGLAAGVLTMLAIPVAFAYAILKHRLFDVRILIRQGVRYALARRVVQWLVPAFLIALFVELGMRHSHDELVSVLGTHSWAYVIVGGLILTARSQRARWLDAIDRRFFRDRYDGQRLLHRVAADLHDATSIVSAAPRVVTQIEAAFHAEHAAAFIRREGQPDYVVAAAEPRDKAPTVIDADLKLVALVGVLDKPVEVGLPDARWLSRQLPAEEVDWLRTWRVELVAPITRPHAGLEGLITLGPRRSEEPYTVDDVELVAAIAGNLALLLQRPAAADDQTVLEECPTCQTCYNAGTGHCPSDGAVLTSVPTPHVIAGRYRLNRRLGQGGMGTVFAATDDALDRNVAVKVIRDALALHGQAARRFQQEARSAAALSHPNIVTVHDFGEVHGNPYLVMELLEGTTLRDLLRAERQLPVEQVRNIVGGVSAGLTAAHARGLVHRDLKPENIFLTRSAERVVPKVLDFGIAKQRPVEGARAEPVATTPGVVVGTPQYMSPEQLTGGDVGPAADLWALGVITFEMLTGIHPVDDLPGSPRDLASDLESVDETIAVVEMPEALRRFFRLALSLDPANRPATPAAFSASLDDALGTWPGARTR